MNRSKLEITVQSRVVSAVTYMSNEGAKGELSCCQQMLSVDLFITYPAEKALYYYTLMQCQAAAGAYNKPAALVRLIPMIFGPLHQTTNWDPAYIKMHNSSVRLTRLRCVCTSLYVGVMKDEESISSHVSSASPLASHSTEKNLRVCGYSSDCYVRLTDAFPIVCGLEGRCWATVPVLTILASSHE